MRPATSASASEIIEALAAELARRVPAAFSPCLGLILTGSAARQEATIARRPEGAFWLSDLELLVVTPDFVDPRAAGRELDLVSALIAQDLRSQGISVKLELAPAPERYFSRIRPHLFGYELKHCGRQILGTRNYLDRIPSFDWRLIPAEEAWRLVSNRIVEWLEYLLAGARRLPAEQFYILAKSYLDLLTALTLVTGHYAPGYAARFDHKDAVLDRARRHGCNLPHGFDDALAIAFRYKFNPEAGFEFLWTRKDGSLPDLLRRNGFDRLYDELPAAFLAIWKWLLRPGRLWSNATTTSHIRALASRVRGWAKLLLRSEGATRADLLRRSVRLFRHGSPRVLTYACAARLLDPQSGRTEETLAWVRQRLPMPPSAERGDWTALANATVDFWRRYLRHSYA